MTKANKRKRRIYTHYQGKIRIWGDTETRGHSFLLDKNRKKLSSVIMRCKTKRNTCKQYSSRGTLCL